MTPGAEAPAKIPEVFAFGPSGFQRPVPIVKVAEGVYQGRIHVGQRQGLYRVRPLVESQAFPEIGLYRQEDELNDWGSDEFLLRKIAEFTGGRFQPEASQIFDPGGRSVPSTVRLWPGLLAIALALNVAEVILRKWRGLFAR